jgi:DNA-binding NarL/FixJ family response regulator
VVVTRPRVLIADDHPGFAKALGRVLANECEIVGVVADGSAVTTTAASLQPVVVVVDVNLPNVSGLEVCRQLTRHHPGAKAIVITGMIDDTVRAEALAAGASAFLAKHTSSQDLIEQIKHAWAASTK